MGSGQPVPLSLYIYAPNKILPIIFTLLYALTAAAHIYQCWRGTSWRILGLLPLCGLSFTLGYALRIYNAFDAYLYSPSNTTNLIVYILSQVFIYICPPLLELANYHILGRLLAYIPQQSPMRPKAVLRTFGSVMLVVETVNSLGVSLSANPSGEKVTQELGKGMTLAALGLQLMAILTFVVLAVAFQRRVKVAGIRIRSVKVVLRTLYVSMGLILVRCIYRLVEHVGNTDIDLDDERKLAELSPILRYEVFFYVFDAVLMLGNMVLWNVWNPGRSFATNVYLASDGVTEIEYLEEKKSSIWMRWVPGLNRKTGYRSEEGLEMNQTPSRES